MPGILPMKVIKVGNSAQSRIAQACDRCRSKKIRCDGVRPTCSQCANVGFECRTSDKLSRRAFPRGYTESLEERVRQLEAEVRELKDLLDEKDEKIDMLSAMHGNHRRISPPTSASSHIPSTGTDKTVSMSNKEETFRSQASPLMVNVENSESFFMGPSSGRSFLLSFKRKLQEMGKPCADFNPDAFLHVQGCPPLTTKELDASSSIPPRLFSDRCVNVFFQEWAPLFPVVHKPTFLRTYQEFVSSPETQRNNCKLAQLHLVFSIAGLSFETPDYRQVAASERQWSAALDTLMLESNIHTMQCLILAILYCTVRGDNKRLQHYKSVAVGLSHRLGLHQSQKSFAFSPLLSETRKKSFWTLYTLDCFSAASMGLPKLLKEEAVEAEYPSDTDDEYITEKGFQPSLPGESTRLSSALALFRASRILTRVLESLYSGQASQELSLQHMRTLESELDAWYIGLPPHLRLNFVQDKPSTDITGSRAPLLALTFYYIRSLIYRPAVTSTLGPKSAPALLSIAESSKHIIQILSLLEERNMSFSFCLNRNDTLAICGITLLYQVAELKQDSKLTRDVGRLVTVVINTLARTKGSGGFDLERVARMLVHVNPSTPGSQPMSVSSKQGSLVRQPAQHPSPAPLPLYRKSNYTPNVYTHWQSDRNNAPVSMPISSGAMHEACTFGARSNPSGGAPAIQRADMANLDPYRRSAPQPLNDERNAATTALMPNLDYLSLNNTPIQTQAPSSLAILRTQAGERPRPRSGPAPIGIATNKTSRVSTEDWEALLGSMDGGLHNVYDAIYGGASLINESSPTVTRNTQNNDWSPDPWDKNSSSNLAKEARAQPQSAMSDESLSSGEEMATSELGISVGSAEHQKCYATGGSGDSFGNDGLFYRR